MIERRVPVRSPDAVNTLSRDVTIKENLPPFFCLQDMAKFVTEQGNVSGVFRMDEDPDSRQGYGSAVLQLADGTGKA